MVEPKSWYMISDRCWRCGPFCHDVVRFAAELCRGWDHHCAVTFGRCFHNHRTPALADLAIRVKRKMKEGDRRKKLFCSSISET